MRPVLIALAAAVLLAVTGCGSDAGSADYGRELAPISRQVEHLGAEVSATIHRASRLTEAELQAAFATHARRLGALRVQLDGLHAPGAAQDTARRLSTAMDETSAALAQLADAAERGDARLAARAARRLTRDAATLRAARLDLVRVSGTEA